MHQVFCQSLSFVRPSSNHLPVVPVYPCLFSIPLILFHNILNTLLCFNVFQTILNKCWTKSVIGTHQMRHRTRRNIFVYPKKSTWPSVYSLFLKSQEQIQYCMMKKEIKIIYLIFFMLINEIKSCLFAVV